jgi:hypothetical protein
VGCTKYSCASITGKENMSGLKADISTHSEGKDKSVVAIRNFFNFSGKSRPREYRLMTVGSARKGGGLSRHLNEGNACGYADSCNVVVDFVPELVRALVKERDFIDRPVHILEPMSFREAINKAVAEKWPLTECDFDVLGFSREEELTCRLAAKHKIKRFAITVTTRSPESETIKRLAERYEVPKEPATGGTDHGKFVYHTKDVLAAFMRNIFVGYDMSDVMSYRGKGHSTMVTIAVKRKDSK